MTSRFPTLPIVCLAVCCLLSAALADTPAAEVEWRLEYDKARKEAIEKNRPLVIDIGTENCFWCKQLDQRTFRDPDVVALLNEKCVPLKVDAQRHATLVEALRVQSYPTLVFATPEGKILGYQEGFLEASGLQERIHKVLATLAAPPEWMTRDLQEAARAVLGSDYIRAIVLLKKILEDGKGLPVQAQARQMLQEIEQQAAGRCQQAKQLIEQGHTAEAVEHVLETVRLYSGTKAAREVGQLLVGLASRKAEPSPAPASAAPPPPPASAPTPPPAPRNQLARDLLTQARVAYGRKQFLTCLDRCEAIVAAYSDLPEAAEAGKLAAEIKTNPDLTKQACDQMGDRLSLLYLNMAESWLKKGQPQQAVFYLERVVQTFPHSRNAEMAQVRLTQIQGAPVRTAEVKK